MELSIRGILRGFGLKVGQVVRSGSVCRVRAGEKHSLRNLGDDDMLVFTIYDPPRDRRKD